MKRTRIGLILLLCATGLAACQPAGSSGAVAALEDYLQALVVKDEATLTLLSCADWEVDALLELDAFQSVETSLNGLACQQTSEVSGSASVMCQGRIVSSYFGEDQSFDLSERTYSLVEQNGEWLVCGY